MSINLIDYRYSLPFPNAISGLLISNNGTTSIDTSSGVCTDSTNALNIVLAATMTKTQASWTAGTGNGGLDTGVIANSTWYHFYVIYNATTNATDVIFSTSASTPTMPSGYTYKRLIGSALTDGSHNWTAFIAYEIGNGLIEYTWYVPVQAYTVSSSGTSAITATLTGCPTGIKVKWVGSAAIINSVGYWLLTSLDQADTIPSSSVFTLVANSSTPMSSEVVVITNTSAQVRHRISSSATTITLISKGWTHFRI